MPRAIARLAAPCAIAAMLAAGLIGCNSEEESSGSPTTGDSAGADQGGQSTGQSTDRAADRAADQAAERQPDQTYTVRGEIRQLPSPENPASGLQIRHENIPDFVNRAGEVVGMKPMIMPFTPAEDLDLSALSVGDKVSFTFDVDWDAAPMMLVTNIEPLPADTELDFAPPQGEAAPEPESAGEAGGG